MTSSKATIDEVAGYLGIGSLQILGLFLILDGLTGFFHFIEIYSKTNSWSLFVSIALVAMAYLMGIVSSTLMSVVFTDQAQTEKAILDSICSRDRLILYELFSDYRRNMSFMRGSMVSALFLSVGAICEAQSGFMQQWSIVAYVGAAFGLAFLPLAVVTMNRMSQSMLMLSGVETSESVITEVD